MKQWSHQADHEPCSLDQLPLAKTQHTALEAIDEDHARHSREIDLTTTTIAGHGELDQESDTEKAQCAESHTTEISVQRELLGRPDSGTEETEKDTAIGTSRTTSFLP